MRIREQAVSPGLVESPSPLYEGLAARLDLDAGNFVPLYEQLKDQLRTILTDVEPGLLMPSERELLELTGVGRATVRRAIGDLVQEGLLISRQGRGTFTAPRRVEPALDQLAGFTESMMRIGHTPTTVVHDTHAEAASQGVAEHLGIDPGADVYVIERLRLIDGTPAMIEQCHLAATLVPGILQRDLSGSLYELLTEVYNVRPVAGTEGVVAVNADARTARLLDVPIASALLATTRHTYTATRIPIEYTVRHARGDLWSFRVRLHEAEEFATVDGPHSFRPTEATDSTM